MISKLLHNKTVIVIGGAGFIGSHLVDLLTQTKVKKITIYDDFSRGKLFNLSTSLKDKRVNIYDNGGDICNFETLNDAIKGHKIVFHLAAKWLLHCNKYPVTAFDVNVRGTFNILESCRINKIDRLIFSSSASVYGNAISIPMKETHPYNNKNLYGATKISCESLMTAYSYQYGLNFIALRYMNVYGPRQDNKNIYSGVVPIFLKNALEGNPISINGDGSQKFDFVYVKDIAKANILAASIKSIKSNFYNVGSGKQTSIKNLVKLMNKLIPNDIKVSYQQYSISDSRSLVKNRLGCLKLITKELGYSADFNLHRGISEILKFYEYNT